MYKVNRHTGNNPASQIRIHLNDSENKVFELKFKRVREIFLSHGVVLNQHELIRSIFLNLDDIDLLNVLIPVYKSECPEHFKA